MPTEDTSSEPNEALSKIETQVNERKKELQKLIDQLNNFMRPIKTEKVNGNEVHLMTGNVTMIKYISNQEQKEHFEQLIK